MDMARCHILLRMADGIRLDDAVLAWLVQLRQLHLLGRTVRASVTVDADDIGNRNFYFSQINHSVDETHLLRFHQRFYAYIRFSYHLSFEQAGAFCAQQKRMLGGEPSLTIKHCYVCE